MILHPLIYILAAGLDVRAIKHEGRRNLNKKEERESHLSTLLPTVTPTQFVMYRHSPMSHDNLDEFCDRKNNDNLDVCIEWFANKTPSVAPSSASSIVETAEESILKSTLSTLTEVYSATTSPSKTPTILQYKDSDPEKNNEYEGTNHSNTVLIELGNFDMSITIYPDIERLPENSHASSDSRQCEYLAVREHLHEVYTKSFLNPLTSLNLTIFDAGEANVSESIIRSSIFSVTVVFERIEKYPDPAPSELETVTVGAFTGDFKEVFLGEFCRYHKMNDDVTMYDVVVEKLALGQDEDSFVDSIERVDLSGDKKMTIVLPISGIIAGIVIICGIGLAYMLHKKRKREEDKPTSSGPLHHILQRNKTHGDFSGDDILRDFDGNDINDAYMDSASITSRSLAESAFNLNFCEGKIDNLLDLVDVEIALPEEFE